MGILDSILSAGGGNAVSELAKNFGISEGDATKAIGQLAPSISQGLKQNMSSSDGLGALLGAISSGKHQRYVDNPEELTREDTVTDGNNILGHIFGSKDVSRNVAQSAAEKTGLDSGILKKMLPMVAAMAMGSLSKNNAASGMANQLSGGVDSSGVSGMLSQFLDADNDGSVTDDLLNMAKKFF
jgi:hypothetical protein